MSSVQSNAKIINQLPVPKVIFPASVAIYNLVNFGLTIVPLLLVILFTEWSVPWTFALFPLMLIPLFLLSMGVALILSVLNMFFDDTQHLRSVVFRALYFLCPILYKREHLPDWLVQWVVLNPMFGIIENMRRLCYYGEMPVWTTYWLNIGGSLLFLAFGLWVFKKASDKFIYFL
jgi:ABC-type polysaccharide/polyol phosphate export permease